MGGRSCRGSLIGAAPRAMLSSVKELLGGGTSMMGVKIVSAGETSRAC